MLRSIRWSVRILFAAGVGILTRKWRRLRRKPPRIWHGFLPLHTVTDHARVDRLAGYPTCVVAFQVSHFSYDILDRARFDVVWEDLGVPRADWHWRSLEHLLLHGEVWVAFFDCLLFSGRKRINDLAFRLIKLVGIRIVAVTQGGDVVHRSRKTTRFDWVGRWQESYPSWDLAEHAPLARQRIDTFCEFADLVIADGVYTARFLHRVDLCFKYFPVDLSIYSGKPALREESRALIVHATNHRPVKGTDFVIAASGRLNELGLSHDLRLVERVSRAEALAIYGSADIVADQFCMGSFGCFAMECLALGKPVIGYSDQEELGLPQFNLPIINGNRFNLDVVMAILLGVPALRERIGKASRRAAERYLSSEALAEVWTLIYDAIWWKTPLNLDGTAIFGPERTSRSFTENPADPEFWPVDVSDLLPEIVRIAEEVRARAPSTARI